MESIARANNLLIQYPDNTYNARIKLTGYERGLLSSHARFAVTMTLPLPGHSANEQLAEIDTTLWHGPFPLETLRHGDFLPKKYWGHEEVLVTFGPAKMALGAVMNGKPPLVLDGSCTYGDHCTITGNVPPVDIDLGTSSKARLSFGGVQMRFDANRHSDSDFGIHGNAQLLPLSIGGQNFGSGHFTFAIENDQSVTEQVSWETGQWESKATIAYTRTSRGSPPFNHVPLSFIKTASLDLSLSRPMLIDLAAQIQACFQGVDLAAAKRQTNQTLDLLLNNPEVAKFIRAQGDLLVSNWQYADGKLITNGQENPELLEWLKQSYPAQQQAKAEPDGQTPAPDVGGSAASAAPSASAPASAASGQ